MTGSTRDERSWAQESGPHLDAWDRHPRSCKECSHRDPHKWFQNTHYFNKARTHIGYSTFTTGRQPVVIIRGPNLAYKPRMSILEPTDVVNSSDLADRARHFDLGFRIQRFRF